jgi:PIN domain nuclease of toxin-antitoxin system
MNILLDTCSYIWFITDPGRLSKKAVTLIHDKESVIYLSAISLWEINLKVKIKKLQIKGELGKLIRVEEFEAIIKPLGFLANDSEYISKITLHHKDPFDLMLICQALSNDFTILTPDPHIRKYPIKTIW